MSFTAAMSYSRTVSLAALLPALAAGLAYQIARPLEVSVSNPLLAAWLLDGVHGGEGDERWTRARSQVRLPEPGPGLAARVEVDIAGWRPRGQPVARVQIEAGSDRLVTEAARGRATLDFPTVTSGWWSSSLAVRLASDTFSPGGGDTRTLGVRLYAVRLIPTGPLLAARRPPLRMLAWAALCGALLFVWVARSEPARERRARRTVAGFALALGAALIGARLLAALALPGLGLVLLGLVLGRALAPRSARLLAACVEHALASGRAGLRALAQPASLAAVALGLAALVVADQRWSALAVDPTSPTGMVLARGFGALDAQDGQRFRHVRAGAELRLDALGAGARQLELRVAATRAHPNLVLGTLGSATVAAPVDTAWTQVTTQADTGARVLVFGPAAEQAGLRLAGLRILRTQPWPTWWPLAAALLAGLLVGAVLGSLGLARATPWGVLITLLGSALATLQAPLAMLLFLPTLAALTACGTALALALRAWTRARGDADNGAVHATAALGFVAWAAALTFPLYRGGHFLFHSAIAREIWQGRFLTYYLPSPDSMLARQAQWGNVVVPHPCLYHTLVAPLAALPEAWFHFAEKLLLAGLLASLVLVAGRLANHLAGPRAAVLAAILTAAAVPGFQLLGLGHLMALLGCATGAWALAFVAHHDLESGRRPVFVRLVLLLALGFLAYTATLLFLSASVAFLVAAWARQARARARVLALAWLCAAVLAFGAYYVNWALPFVRDSLPHLVAGARPVASAATDAARQAPPTPPESRALGYRLAAQPGKLDYSFGTWLVPALGLLGLALAPRHRTRDVLLAWAVVLPAFIGMDLFFNLLLKHHYFTVVPLCTGAGLLLARLWGAGRAARVLAATLLAAYLALGMQCALDVATGAIP